MYFILNVEGQFSKNSETRKRILRIHYLAHRKRKNGTNMSSISPEKLKVTFNSQKIVRPEKKRSKLHCVQKKEKKKEQYNYVLFYFSIASIVNLQTPVCTRSFNCATTLQ